MSLNMSEPRDPLHPAIRFASPIRPLEGYHGLTPTPGIVYTLAKWSMMR